MLRSVAKTLLRATPRSFREQLRKAYIWNTRTGVYRRSVASDDIDTATGAWNALAHRYGYLRALREGRCVSADGTPTPWFTYPAIEFLQTLDLSSCKVFEYGAGNSTRFWAARAARVDAVEADAAWHASLVQSLPSHCSVLLETDMARYVAAVQREPGGYDVIVVDGQNAEQGRFRCAAAAVEALRPGGMIILDDASCLPRSCSLLRGAGLIEVPMSGFSPLNSYTNTTAIYLRRDFAIPRRNPDQCAWSAGAPHNVWEGEPHEIIVDAPLPDVREY